MLNSIPSPNEHLADDAIRGGMDLIHLAYRCHMERISRDLKRADLGLVHYRCLSIIRRDPGLLISELIRSLGVTKQSAGRVLDTLLARHLVTVEMGEDRRHRLLHLTAEGEVLEEQLSSVLYEHMAGAYAGLSREAVAGFWQVAQNLLTEDVREAFALSQPVGLRHDA